MIWPIFTLISLPISFVPACPALGRDRLPTGRQAVGRQVGGGNKISKFHGRPFIPPYF